MLEYEITARRVDAHDSLAQCKQELMHENIRKYGTVYNTVAPGTELKGVMRRSA